MNPAEAMREACARELNRLDAGSDCENNRGMDMETGEGLCALEDRGELCVCGEVNATLLKAQALIRALPLPTPSAPDHTEALRLAQQRIAELENSLDWFADENGDGAQREAYAILHRAKLGVDL